MSAVEVRPREPVVFAVDFDELVAWYGVALGLETIQRHEEGYHYAVLAANGLRLGVASAEEVGVAPHDRKNNSVVVQVEVDDVEAFFDHLVATGGAVTFGPNHDEKGGFWYGGFHDPEGNPFWVVDRNCP